MAYKSKFTGLQIDTILDSVEGKQNEIEDLESIRSGAAKGATALQSYTEQYKGTITGVSANGTSVATSGVANIPAASTSKYGVTKLSSATNSTSTSLAATASAVKTAYDLANGKQDKLVSGTNIKTINGESILGSGNITLEGGASAYVTDFTILDLYNWAGYQGQHEVDKAGLENALADNIPIFVPVGSSDDGFSGYEILNGYKEDMLYLWVSDNTYNRPNGGFYIETNLSETDSYFEGGTITKINFQNKLVSGTNIKTVNGESLLGSGDISVQASNKFVGNVEIYDASRSWDITIGEDESEPGTMTIRATNSNLRFDADGIVWTERLNTYGIANEIEKLRLYGEGGIDCVSDIGNNYIIEDGTGGGVQDEWYWKITPEGDAKFNDTHITGNLTVDGNIIGAGSSSGGAYSEVNHGTSDTTFTLTPNTFHVWDEVASLTLTLGDETAGVANEFLFQFNSGSTATSLTLPDDIKWANDEAPTIEADKIYQVSILKGLASVLAFDNGPTINLIAFNVGTYSCIAEEGMTWEQWVASEYNTHYASISGDYVLIGAGVAAYNGAPVNKSDVIINGEYYSVLT